MKKYAFTQFPLDKEVHLYNIFITPQRKLTFAQAKLLLHNLSLTEHSQAATANSDNQIKVILQYIFKRHIVIWYSIITAQKVCQLGSVFNQALFFKSRPLHSKMVLF